MISTDSQVVPDAPASRIASAGAVAAGSVFLVACVAALYAPTVAKLAAYWWTNDTYSYAFLVPPISAYVIWLKRDEILKAPVEPAFGLGGLLLTAGLAALVFARASAINVVEELSMVFVTIGIVWLVLGTAMVRALAFPLAYLFAMIPVWDVVTSRLHLPFQLYSASFGVAVLRAFDIPVLLRGVFIELPEITLEVADVCSGVNQLIAILCIGVPLAYLNMRSWPRRVGVVIAAALIALLSNGVRVAMVCLFAYYGIRGADGDIHGPFAMARTMAVSGVGFLALFWLTARFSDIEAEPPRMPQSAARFRRSISGRALAGAAAMILAVLGFGAWHEVHAVAPGAALLSFPQRIGEWQLVRNAAASPELEGAAFDQSFTRTYRANDGTELTLTVGYFERQSQGKELAGFATSRLIAGGLVQQHHDGSTRSVADLVDSRYEPNVHVTYWYAVHGRTTGNALEAKLLTAWSALVHRKSNGVMVIVRAPLPGGGQALDASRARVRSFIRNAVEKSTFLIAS